MPADGDPSDESITQKPEVEDPCAETTVYVVNETVGEVEIAAGASTVNVDGIDEGSQEAVKSSLKSVKA